ncbi:ribonuclease P protein component 1 [Haloarculaceae archaeon H-GB2-1]|nr:ribonuclease P protein component 1 [Haloarculaceae archaeon H-GB1-1]MEA5409082.1 ribonuclease P protein component 1 [Haloarculaceae archaeon H-GB2-1]
MPLTPETLPRHELIGLDVTVAAASNPDVIGIEGKVVTETTRTLGIEGADRVWHVPKDDATFEFALPSGVVTVDGSRLVARPARRTEQTGDSKWR